MVQNEKTIQSYEPALGSRLGDAMKTGWEVLEEIIVVMARLWSVIVLGIVIYILYRRYQKRQRVKAKG